MKQRDSLLVRQVLCLLILGTMTKAHAQAMYAGPPVPLGTATGQIFHWDNTAHKYVLDTELLSDGTTVGIGQEPDGSSSLAISSVAGRTALTLNNGTDGPDNYLFDFEGYGYIDELDIGSGLYNASDTTLAGNVSIGSNPTGVTLLSGEAPKVSVGGLTATQDGLAITMPSGARGGAIKVLSSEGTLLFSVDASGNISTNPNAFGNMYAPNNTEHFGSRSSAVGPGNANTAVGSQSVAGTGSDIYCTSLGAYAAATGAGTAIGANTQAPNASVAIGTAATALGTNTFALGRNCSTADGTFGSIAAGFHAAATATGQFVAGSDIQNPFFNITDVYFGDGVVSAAPTDIAYHATGGNGTDVAGANIIVAGGRSTGSAAGGKVYLATASTGSPGAAANTLTNRVQVDQNGLTALGGLNSADGSAGLTTTIPLAKLTTNGANGTITIKNGLIVAVSLPN